MVSALQNLPEPTTHEWSVLYNDHSSIDSDIIRAHECHVNDNGDLLFIEIFEGREQVHSAYSAGTWLKVEPELDLANFQQDQA